MSERAREREKEKEKEKQEIFACSLLYVRIHFKTTDDDDDIYLKKKNDNDDTSMNLLVLYPKGKEKGTLSSRKEHKRREGEKM